MENSDDIKDLFRRFIAGHVSYEETVRVVQQLASTEGQRLYEQVMDEHQDVIPAETENFTVPELERRFAALEQVIAARSRPLSVQRSTGRRAWLLAASLTGLLMLAGFAWYFWQAHAWVKYSTAYGELKTITLPDGSRVVLNGHSQLSYPQNWGETGREVHLDGEAYFQVTKTIDRKKFIVKIRNSGSIEVLGTEFNVNHRAGRSKVMLESGRIRLTVGQKQLVMQPGELAAFADNGEELVTHEVDPAVYKTWTERKIVFDQTTLGEVVEMLRQTYDLDVRVSDPRLLGKKLSGTAPIHDIDAFLEALSGTFGLTVSRTRDHILIQAQ